MTNCDLRPATWLVAPGEVGGFGGLGGRVIFLGRVWFFKYISCESGAMESQPDWGAKSSALPVIRIYHPNQGLKHQQHPGFRSGRTSERSHVCSSTGDPHEPRPRRGRIFKPGRVEWWKVDPFKHAISPRSSAKSKLLIYRYLTSPRSVKVR